MNDIILNRLRECEINNKKMALDVIRFVYNASVLARSKGILELEAISDVINDDFVETVIELVVDGNDMDLVEEIVTNLILTSKLNDHNFIRKILVAKGLCMVAKGFNPRFIVIYLSSLLGLELSSEIVKNYDELFVNTEFNFKNFNTEGVIYKTGIYRS